MDSVSVVMEQRLRDTIERRRSHSLAGCSSYPRLHSLQIRLCFAHLPQASPQHMQMPSRRRAQTETRPMSISATVWPQIDGCCRRPCRRARVRDATCHAVPYSIGATVPRFVNSAGQSCLGAALRLLSICALIGWLLRSRRISDEAPHILSQVAFNLMIPCALFTIVASTLANRMQWAALSLPLVSLLQIGAGYAGSRLANAILDPDLQRRSGWHPLKPAQSAKAIAMSTATASGIPAAALALLPKFGNGIPAGVETLTTACCTFGSSFEGPLACMALLIPASALLRTKSYLAILLIGWAPLMWSYGYRLFAAAADPSVEDQQTPFQSFDEDDITTAQMALMASSADQELDQEQRELHKHLAARRNFAAAKGHAEKALTLPLVALLGGIAVGISPIGAHLFCSAPHRLPVELNVCLGLVKAGIEIIALLASGLFAVQALTFSVSLFQKIPVLSSRAEKLPLSAFGTSPGAVASTLSLPERSGQAASAKEESPSVVSKIWSTRKTRDALTRPWGILGMLIPRSGWEWKSLLSIAAVRYGLVPASTIAFVKLLISFGWFPTDPACLLAVLVQGVMPPSQDLMLLVNLRTSTAFLAPYLAKMLLRLSIIGILPSALWIGLFLSWTPALAV